jgi:hypothetical protein
MYCPMTVTTRLHGRDHVPVAQADRAAAPVLTAAGVVAHQLINHAGGNAAVLQPGRECVPQIVGAVQIKAGEAGSGSRPAVDTSVVADR